MLKVIKWFVKEKDMNPLELAAQKVVISLLNEIIDHHLDIGRLITAGKASDEKIEEVNQMILNKIRLLHPMFDVAHALIPESVPVLHKALDWCQEIYHQSLDKDK